MAIDRDRAFEVSENGFLLEGGAHFSSASGVPTHTGLKGDMYLDTNTWLLYFLRANGSTWTQLSATDIAFQDPEGLFNSTILDVSHALDNIRQQRVSQLDTRDTDTESNYSLLFSSNTFHDVTGSGSGYYIEMPDATTCLTGQEFEIFNDSTNKIEIRDAGSNVIAQVNTGDVVRLILEDKATSNGNWLIQISSATATGVQSYSVGTDTSFATSSSTDVIITGLTVTPVSGRYGLWFSGDVTVSANNAIGQCVAFIDGVSVEATRRDLQGVGSNFKSSIATLAEVSVDGTEAVDIRVNISSGSLTVTGRRLLLIRLGS